MKRRNETYDCVCVHPYVGMRVSVCLRVKFGAEGIESRRIDCVFVELSMT